MPVPDYQRKLYALLQSLHSEQDNQAASELLTQTACLRENLSNLGKWWKQHGQHCQNIGASSDRVNLDPTPHITPRGACGVIRHPISGEQGTVAPLPSVLEVSRIPEAILNETDPKKVFWWFWRFYPENWLNPPSEFLSDGLLYPAHRVLPDCPLHSYQATVSALAGAMYSEAGTQAFSHPYLLIFTFSPVQDFIKASRKFLDFWAGSYMLHYLSAHLCWHIADTYGPDALIVPSLWGQDIIDARLLEQYKQADPSFYQVLQQSFREIGDRKTPVERFTDRSSSSLSTAGFPNVITALVPGLGEAKRFGENLSKILQEKWSEIGTQVRDHIRANASQEITQSSESWNSLGQEIISGLSLESEHRDGLVQQWEDFGRHVRANIRQLQQEKQANSDTEQPIVTNHERHNIFRQALESLENSRDRLITQPDLPLLFPYLHDLRKWILECNWEWNEIWHQQLTNTWEPYWATVPLGDPQQPISIEKQNGKFDADWKTAQTTLSQAWQKIPSEAEEHAFDTLNVGTWWGSFQQRLRIAIQSVKNTRVWNIPAAPGERSTLSGQYSAVHPNLNYRVVQRRGAAQDFREGGGLPEGTMRLFWLLMAQAYPGLFNGSERLNALELTKRMAWQFGGVAASLGIPLSTTINVELTSDAADALEIPRQLSDEDYEQLIRFPNLSSIASARYVHDAIAEAKNRAEEDASSPVISQSQRYWNSLAREIRAAFGSDKRNRFACRTRGRSFQVSKTDQQINPRNRSGQDFNGVMFSAKWLAEDMALDKHSPDNNSDNSDVSKLRRAVETAHQRAGFKEGSPSDWWAIVLADGDGMGQYISGSKLENYQKYIDQAVVDQTLPGINELNATQKRMGPATHIGLNRALLDFSNRLVPYLTEKRFCGKVIYSGGDDVMAVLPIEDVPEYLRSLRAAWSGDLDSYAEQDPICAFRRANTEDPTDSRRTGYWYPKFKGETKAEQLENKELSGLPNRPLFTMGNTATLSMGVVIAHKSVPLPTVLENLWVAEGDRAKEMVGKDGICFRVIYSGGNTLEALMKGHLLDQWWQIAQHYDDKLGPMLHRLAEELPKRADVNHPALFGLAAQVLLRRRDEARQMEAIEQPLLDWLNNWGHWAQDAAHADPDKPGANPEALGYLLRFTAFWVDKMVQRQGWQQASETSEATVSNEPTVVGRG